MDDATDRGESRAPELEDLVSLCRALNAEGARYVLIGGFAVLLHGLVRTTKAIDLLVEASDENVRAVKRALGTLPDNAAAQVAVKQRVLSTSLPDIAPLVARVLKGEDESGPTQVWLRDAELFARRTTRVPRARG